ncbi:MAG TPA: hypothetical protein VM925_15420 [Labilithrix sp.]|nr:hypothetical protein [Labilithrix sp.]
MTRSFIVTSIVCAVLTLSTLAHADGEPDDAAAAESLFQEGRKLMDEKRYADACPKFAASQKIAPAVGTLLNLADCHEKNNQLASAYTRFQEAAALAQQLGRPNREQTARERAARLEPRIIKLTILSRGGIDVKLDGAPLDPAVLGTPRPIDSGRHTLEASAKGKKPFTTTVDVSEKSRNASITIPDLEDDGASAADMTAALHNETAPVDDDGGPSPPKPADSGWSTQKTIGVVAAGVGVLGLGLGSYLGLKASSTWSAAEKHCAGRECDQEGVNLASDAKSTGNMSTISFIASGVLLAGGAVLFLTAPNGSKSEPSRTAIRVGIGPGNVVVGGVFR